MQQEVLEPAALIPASALAIHCWEFSDVQAADCDWKLGHINPIRFTCDDPFLPIVYILGTNRIVEQLSLLWSGWKKSNFAVFTSTHLLTPPSTVALEVEEAASPGIGHGAGAELSSTIGAHWSAVGVAEAIRGASWRQRPRPGHTHVLCDANGNLRAEVLNGGANTTIMGPPRSHVTLYIVTTLAFGVSHSSSNESSVT